VVPSTDQVVLAGDAVNLEATVLYADLAQSSQLGTDFDRRTGAKVIRAFLYCMCRLIKECGGEVTSFDGDRVMGVFLEGPKNTNAAKCALKMNHAVSHIIAPMLRDHLASLKTVGFRISHCVGVDTSNVLVVRAGQRGANDLVWIGRAPNLAAKLSDIRQANYRSWVSADVYSRMDEPAKYGRADGDYPLLSRWLGRPVRAPMWRRRFFPFAGRLMTAYASNWSWRP
jgi:class 3 adenylate cyclase